MWNHASNGVPQQMHRLGDGSFVEFPLRVVSTTAVDFRNSRSIQFCDVLAGLATRHFNPRTGGDDRKFMDDVIDAGLKEITYNGMRNSYFPTKSHPGP